MNYFNSSYFIVHHRRNQGRSAGAVHGSVAGIKTRNGGRNKNQGMDARVKVLAGRKNRE